MRLPGMVCALSTAPDHPDLKVTKIIGITPKQRKSYFIAGISPDLNYSTYHNTIDAAECAVKERLFYVKIDGQFQAPPRPEIGSYTLALIEVFNIFKKHAVFSNPMETKQFAMSYQAPKQQRYLRAVESLERKPFRPQDSFIGAFLKFEKYLFSPNKVIVPRIISPRADRFTVSLGRYIKPIEKKIYAIVNNNIFGSPTIMKGLNQEQRGQVIHDHWNSFSDPIAIGIDAKRFDQHVSIEALKWEHSIYKLFYPGSKEFRSMLKLQERNNCFISMPDGSLKYKTIGTRASGDVNTALGNCLISCALVYAYAKEIGVFVKLVNDGDDCVLFLERRDEQMLRNNLHAWFIGKGFNMEIEPTVHELEQVSFCQSSPIWDGNKYIMVRDPRKSLTKDCVALKPLDNPKVSKMWMASVGKCGMSLTGGIPVLQDFYQCFINHSEGAKMLTDPTMDASHYYKAHGMRREYDTISPRSRYSFWLAFGIPPDAQLCIEQYYKTVKLTSEIVTEAAKYAVLPI